MNKIKKKTLLKRLKTAVIKQVDTIFFFKFFLHNTRNPSANIYNEKKIEKITLAAMLMRSCRAELVVNINEYFFTKNGRVHTQTYKQYTRTRYYIYIIWHLYPVLVNCLNVFFFFLRV